MQQVIPVLRTLPIDVSAFDFIDNIAGRPVSRSVTGNVATLKLDRPHKIDVGHTMLITGVGGAGYNGYFVVASVPTPSSLTYALTHVDEAETVDTDGIVNHTSPVNAQPFLIKSNGAGNIRYSTVESARAKSVTRKVLTNVATIRTEKKHGLLKGMTVMVQGMADNAYNGPFTITTCPTPNSFSYALVHADEGETTDIGGVIDETQIKAVVAQVYFQDPEVCRKVFKDATTATNIIIGYVPKL